MPYRRLLLAIVFLVLLAGIVLWFSSFPSAPPRQSVTFPDGMTIAFASTSYGKPGLTPTLSWKRHIAFLPDSFLRLLHIDPLPRFSSPTNHLTIWFLVKPLIRRSLLQCQISLADENGVECSAVNYFPYSYSTGPRPNDPTVEGLDLTAFPRRGKTFKLRFYSGTWDKRSSLLGEITVPNPVFRAYPQWQPNPLPVIRTNGDVAITLTKLVTGVRMFESKPATTNEESWVNADFTYAENSKPCLDWQVDTIQFSDATGNFLGPSAWRTEEPKPGRETFICRAPLWPAESAWKLDTVFKRKNGERMDPKELWSITNLALPENGATNALNLATNINGVNVELLSLTDKSSTSPETHQVSLALHVPALPTGMRFDIFKTTGQGIRTEHDGGGIHLYDYVIPEGTHTFDAQIAVYRELTAEFTVKPTTPPASNSVPKTK